MLNQANTCDVRNGAILRNPQSLRMDVEWIRTALRRPGKSQAGLARALGRDPSAVTKLLQGSRQLKAAEIAKVQAYLAAQPEATARPDWEAEFQLVPVYDIRASAGAGSLTEDGEPIYFHMFRRQWLDRMTVSPGQLSVVQVSGDSMWDTLHDGDHVLLDRSQQNIRREGLYVIRIDEMLQIKRISMHPVSKLVTIKSDNPSYPTYDGVSPGDLNVVGRVVWIGRALG